MHKFILVAVLVLASVAAQAGEPRSLTLASNEEPVAAEPGASEAPKYVARPSANARQPKAEGQNAGTEKTAAAPRAEKPRRRGGASTEARVIHELHRHGIYW